MYSLMKENKVRNEMACILDNEQIKDETTVVKDEPVDYDHDNLTTEENIDQFVPPTFVECIGKPYLKCETKSEEECNLKGLENEENEDDFSEGMDESVQEDWKTNWGIRCNECGKTFPFKSTFDKHYHTTYNKKPEYTCTCCDKTMLKYSTFRSHRYRHTTEDRYKCEYCQKGFSMKKALNVHMLARHSAVNPFLCKECGTSFVTIPGLATHLERHKNNQQLNLPCNDCGKILHSRSAFSVHKNVHKLGRRFMCDVCGKTFTQKVNMLQHVKYHTGERPFPCDKCGKHFVDRSKLIRHFTLHSENRPFQCNVCLKVYKTDSCLKKHALIHTGTKPHVCNYCNKGFLRKSDLKQHLNIHTGERPYGCKLCDYTCTNYPNYLKHLRGRHKVEPRDLRPIENQEEDRFPQEVPQQ